MIVHGILFCGSFLIIEGIFIVSKALLISSATVIVRAGGVIWLNPFATVLFNSRVACTLCCVGVFGMFTVTQRIRLFSSVFAITERRDVGIYEVPWSMSSSFFLGGGLC